MVRITVGFDDKGKQMFKILGYVKTRKEGLEMLAEYHRDPSAMENTTTFAEVYDMLMKKKEGTVSISSMRGYQVAFKDASRLHDMKMADIRTKHLQDILDTKKSRSSKVLLKNTYMLMFTLAEQHDIVTKNYASFLEVGKSEDSKKDVYTDKEIELLWEYQGNLFVDVTLILLYTGMRIGELLEVDMANIHLDEQYLIGGSKTDAGKNRIIALADKIMPIVKRLYGDGSKPSLVMNEEKNKAYTYNSFVHPWSDRMEALGINRKLHEARHTCISNLYKTDARPELIKRQVGHSHSNVTEKVYLHVDAQQLLEVVNKLK